MRSTLMLLLRYIAFESETNTPNCNWANYALIDPQLNWTRNIDIEKILRY